MNYEDYVKTYMGRWSHTEEFIRNSLDETSKERERTNYSELYRKDRLDAMTYKTTYDFLFEEKRKEANRIIKAQKKSLIKDVIFNDPATIVIWSDGTKTVVKKGKNDIYDPEKGLAMAIAKKFLGNQGWYYDIFKQWLPVRCRRKKNARL